MPRSTSFIRRLQIVKPLLAAFFLAVVVWALLSNGRIADVTARGSIDTPGRLLPPAVDRFQVNSSPVITLTKEDQFPGAGAEPGETITYTIVVTNESITDALGVTLSDTIDLHTNFVDGSLRASPMAAGDAYDAVGNTRIAITPPNGLLANDVDPDDPAPNPAFNDGLTIVLSDTTSANGGDVDVSDDGSFTYDPPPGFEGVDTFTYTIEDGHGLTDVGTVTVSVSDVVWYVDHTAPSSGDGRSHSPFDSVATFNSTAADAPGDVIFLYEQGGGPYDNGIILLDNQQLIGQGVDLTNTIGLTPPLGSAFPGVTSNPTLDNTTADNGSHGVVLAQNNALHGLNVGDTGGVGITGANFGTFTVSTASVVSSGAILNLDTGTLDAAFDALSTTGSAGGGVSLTSVDGDLTASNGSIAGTSGIAFHVNGGSVEVNYPGAITQSAAARIVQVQNRLVLARAVRLSGNATCDTSCTGIYVADNNGGTVNFSGSSKVLNTGANTAVTFSNNTGAAILFTNGGLDIDTTSGDGINATGGGAITVVGSSNHVDTTVGTGVSVVNTAIGVGGMTFQSISVNGATNGIVLNNTGSSGGLTVTGNGGACTIAMPTCTGGRIQSTTGADGAVAGSGVYLADTGPVSLSLIRIDNHPNYAIFGESVNGFSLIDSVVDGNNGNNDALDEGSIRFVDLLGSGAITRSDISGGHEDNLRIVNETGTLDRLVITDSSFHDNSDLLGNDGILLESRNSAVIYITVNGTSFSAHRGDHFDANATDNSTLDVVFTNNTMTGGHPNALGQTFILSNGGSAEVTFQVEDNSINGAILSAFTFFQSAATTASSSLIGTFSGNTVGTTGVNGSGSAQGHGAVVNATGDGTVTILADNNEIRQWSNAHGFLVQAGDGSPIVNATISNSTITEPNTDSFPLNGLHLNAGTTSAGAASVCLDVQGTDMVGAGAFGADDFRLRQRNNSTVNLPGYGGSSSDTAAVVTFVQSNNIGAPTGSASVSGSGGGFTGSGSSCSTPSVANDGEDPDLFRELLVISDWSRSTSERTEPGPLDLLTLEEPRTIDSLSRSVSSPDGVSQHVVEITVPGRLAKPLAAPVALPILATPGDTAILLADPFTLPGHETFTVTFAVTIAAPLPAGVDSVQNQAAVMGSNFGDVLSVDPNPHADFPSANGETITPLTIPADLEVAKDDGQTTAVPGAPLTYTIVASNNGPNAIFGATVEDVFPAAVTNVAWICEAGPGSACTLSGSGDIVDTVDLMAGSAVTYTAVVTVDSAATGALANTASITETTILSDPVPANNASTDTNTLTPEVDVALAKSDAADPVVAGSGPGNLTYTITATNAGPSDASNVTISETLSLPPGVAVDSFTPSAGAFISPTWTLPDLDAGQSETLTVELTVDATADAGTGVISDTATVMGADQTLINTVDDSATETTSVVHEVDLAVTMSESADPVTAGSGAGNLTYVVNVENLGPSNASGVVLTDTLALPAGVTLDSVIPGGSTSWDGADTWTVGDLPAGDSETLTLVLTVGPSTAPGTNVVGNEAALTAVDATETSAANDTAAETTSVDTAADLVITKSDAPDPVSAGELLTYTVAITNNGPSDAQNVVATDVLTDALTLQSTSGCAEDPGGAPTCSLGTIPTGGTAHYTITALVDSATLSVTMTNTVTVASTTPEAAPGDESAAIATTVHVVADLELRKVDNPDPVLAGEALTYTLTLTNYGPSQGWGVYVNDRLPLAFNHTGNDCGVSYSRPDPFEWVINDMPAGTVLTCVITGTVDAGVSDVITNTAFVNTIAFVTDPNPSNDSLEEPTTVFDNLFTVGNAVLTEGDAGTTAFTFTISRTNMADPASVDVATAAGTATAGADYTTLPTTTVNFAAGGNLTQTVTVDIAGDAVVELDETFFVNLSNPAAGGIADGQGVGTILNDDDATLSISDVSHEEGDASATSFVFSVTLSAAIDTSLTVDYATAADTASATDGDYTPNSGTLAFDGTAGETQTIVVDVAGDAIVELDETFHVDLSNVSAAGRDVTLADAQGTGAILNDDNAELTVTDAAANEGDSGTMTHVFSVTLSVTVDTPLSVDYATANGNATVADGDYAPTSGTLAFGGMAGETLTITIDAHGDAVVERDEIFHVDLNNVAAAGRDVTLSPGRGTGTILNDDNATVSIGNAEREEGDSGPTTFAFSVTLSAAVDTSIAVDYATADDSATVADGDYVPVNDTLIFGGTAGETLTVTVDVQGDTTIESDETFLVALTDVTAAGRDVTLADEQGQGIILNDDDSAIVYLPMVYVLAGADYPDLVVDELAVVGDEIQIVIRNQGAAPVTDAFWVDAYVDPDQPPTAVNETWPTVGDHGAVWGVGGNALPLLPGRSLTLTLNDAYYEPALSHLPAAIAAGTPLYAQVDSAHADTDYGAVLEAHEVAGDPYNNVLGPVYAASYLFPAVTPFIEPSQRGAVLPAR